MSSDEIDRLLREGRTIEPSAEFAGNVMRAVRHSVDDSEGLAFPWARLVPGLVICAVAIVVGALAGAPRISSETVARAAETFAQFQILAWLPATLAGSYVLAWWSMRLAGHR